jgi:hypothetical protein
VTRLECPATPATRGGRGLPDPQGGMGVKYMSNFRWLSGTGFCGEFREIRTAGRTAIEAWAQRKINDLRLARVRTPH